MTTVAAREELLSHSGLFLGLSDSFAGFYHFSFQEFLAGQRLADVENDLLPVFLNRGEFPEWHNTLSLLFASLTREKAARLVTRLVETFSARGPRIQEVAANCLDILLARGDASTAPPKKRAAPRSWQRWCPRCSWRSDIASHRRSANFAIHGFERIAGRSQTRICSASSR